MFREELLSIITTTWPLGQIDNYIKELETRIEDTRELLKEVRLIRKKKLGKKVYDNGPRDGR
jgi:hypothetical protein